MYNITSVVKGGGRGIGVSSTQQISHNNSSRTRIASPLFIQREFATSGGYVKIARESLDPKKVEDFARRSGSKARKLAEDVPPKDTKTEKPDYKGAYVPKGMLHERYNRPQRSWQDSLEFVDAEGAPADEGLDEGSLGRARFPSTPDARTQHIKTRKDGTWFAAAIGTRKRASAHVTLQPGQGNIVINNRPFMDYFRIILAREHALEPFLITEKLGQFDVRAKIIGGGWMGQAGALRLGISRALQNIDPELRPVLKKAGFLQRDEREVERKKPGQPKARKKYQWVKR